MKRPLLYFFVMILTVAAARAQSSDVYLERQDAAKIVKVFPNPTVDFINVRVESSKAENLKITLHNIIGNEMKVETEIVDEHEVRIRVRDFASGYYLLAVKDDEIGLRTIYKVLKK